MQGTRRWKNIDEKQTFSINDWRGLLDFFGIADDQKAELLFSPLGDLRVLALSEIQPLIKGDKHSMFSVPIELPNATVFVLFTPSTYPVGRVVDYRYKRKRGASSREGPRKKPRI